MTTSRIIPISSSRLSAHTSLVIRLLAFIVFTTFSALCFTFSRCSRRCWRTGKRSQARGVRLAVLTLRRHLSGEAFLSGALSRRDGLTLWYCDYLRDLSRAVVALSKSSARCRSTSLRERIHRFRVARLPLEKMNRQKQQL